MAGQWKEALARLQEYIAKNPDIKISRNLTVIPADTRAEFYRLFDETRKAFLEELTPDILEASRALSEAYGKQSTDLVERLGLSEIKLPARLKWVLNNPVEGLSRALFDPLFDLLKGSVTVEDFESLAAKSVSDYWRPLFLWGFDDWVTLSLANRVAPDKVLAPSWSQIKQRCHELQPDEKRGWAEEHVPDPEEVKVIELGHEGYDPSYIISDIILHSSDLGKFVSFGLDITDAAWHAKNANERRDWLPLRRRGFESKPLFNWPSIVVYFDEEPADISIVADFSRFLRPDIMIECVKNAGWHQNGILAKIQARHKFFKPTLGTFIISRYPVPDEVSRMFEPAPAIDAENDTRLEKTGVEHAETPVETVAEPPIRLISLEGYDAESLTPIVDTLYSAITNNGELSIDS